MVVGDSALRFHRPRPAGGMNGVRTDACHGVVPRLNGAETARRTVPTNSLFGLNTSEIAATIPGGRMPPSTSGRMPDATRYIAPEVGLNAATT